MEENHPFIHEHIKSNEEITIQHHGILDIMLSLNNYCQYQSRYKLFRAFVTKLKRYSQIRLHVVEIALGDRKHFIKQDDPNFHTVLLLRTDCELWHKENSLNLLAARLPNDCKYLAWVDADITFLNENWVSDTLNALQHFDICQVFQTIIDLGPEGEVLSIFKSFSWMYHLKHFNPKEIVGYGGKGHTGYGWACTKKIFDKIGGLFAYGVLGSGDRHMAYSFVGAAMDSYNSNITQGYKDKVIQYQKRCKGARLGYVKGSVSHHFHGRKKDRHYGDRWLILVNNQYDPNEHITLDSQGLFYFNPDDDTYNLRREVSAYFTSRHEDSIDIDDDSKPTSDFDHNEEEISEIVLEVVTLNKQWVYLVYLNISVQTIRML